MSKYTPADYLKARIVQVAFGWDEDLREVTIDNYEEYFEGYDCLVGETQEVRESGQATGMATKNYSRHYEYEEVAVKCPDRWVGFTYYTGGGKYGEPSSVEWMEDAYFLDVEEEEVVVTQRTFTKVEG